MKKYVFISIAMLLFFCLAIDLYFNNYGIDFAIPLFSFVVLTFIFAPLDIWFCTGKKFRQGRSIRLKIIAFFWVASIMIWYLIYAIVVVASIAGKGNYGGFYDGFLDVLPLIAIFVLPVIVFMFISYKLSKAYCLKKQNNC